MLNKVLKIGSGLLLLPLCGGFTWQLVQSIFSIPYKPDLPYYFAAGCLAYLTVHLLFKQPILTYVFGHELTHALFAVLFGGSVKAFKASDRGGQVTVTKSNFIITLAPYFFPLYTSLVLILYLILVIAEARSGTGILIFCAGASFMFHMVLTVVFLQTDQKDIREHGAFFSYPLIYLFNLVFAALLVHLLLAQKNAFLDFLGNGIIKSVLIVQACAGKLYTLLQRGLPA